MSLIDSGRLRNERSRLHEVYSHPVAAHGLRTSGDWSDHNGDLDAHFSRDVLLTNIMLYWLTGAIGSSFWPYYARLPCFNFSSDIMPPNMELSIAVGMSPPFSWPCAPISGAAIHLIAWSATNKGGPKGNPDRCFRPLPRWCGEG
jgi:hypothetical protein